MKRKLAAVCAGFMLLSGLSVSFALDKTDNYFDLKKYEEGTKHQDVMHIQNALQLGGYIEMEVLSDFYGVETMDAVKRFQNENELTADGIAGRKTIEAMFEKGLMSELDTKVLKPGDENSSVKVLQQSLMDLGFLKIDEAIEYYGAQTTAAVKDFQNSFGLDADGVAGTLTLRALEENGYLFLAESYSEGTVVESESFGNITKNMLIPGDRHQDVVLLQKALVEEGFLQTDEYTDYYGPETEAAVLQFQEANNLKADGVAGMETIAKMIQKGYVNQVQVVSRQSSERRFGEYRTWNSVMEMIDKGRTVFLIEDFNTGQTFQMLAAYGGVHSDVEPLTKNDAHIIKTLWGGEYSWVRRPVLVHFDGHVIAASLNGMPHAGMDNMPEGQYIDARSGGFGYGYNFDSVKGNDFDGHLCLHFKDSKLHANRKVDSKHQKNVRIAAGVE